MKELLKRMWSVVKAQRGMSLVEIMAASAIASGIALTLAKINKDTSALTKTNEVNTEINYFVSEVSYILSLKENCSATINVPSPVTKDITSIRKVVNGNTTDVYGLQPRTYGQNSFSIESMRISPNGAEGLDLNITINKTNSTTLGGKQVRKKISLRAVIEDGVVKSCNSDTDGIIERAAQAACRGNSARWDADAKECHHDLQVAQCLPGQVLQRIQAGDDTNKEIRTECVPMVKNPITCPAGEYFKSITSEGVISCEAITLRNSARCGQDQYLMNLANGDFICGTIPKCNNNQILRSNANGTLFTCVTVSCVSGDQYFAGFDSAGSPICRPITKNKFCSGPNEYIVSVAPNGVPTCRTTPNHANLTQTPFSFVDGFSSTSWSRKTDAEIAREICGRFSNRRWNGSQCEKSSVQAPINGGWSDWSNWTACANGKRTRTRTCTNPAPANGGTTCIGSSTETDTASCSSSCGETSFCHLNRGYTLECFKDGTNSMQSAPGMNCDGYEDGGNTAAMCQSMCRVDGGWSSWSSWSSCSGGVQTRTRTCTNPAPSSGGSNCSGNATETQSCNTCDRARDLLYSSGYTSDLYCCPGNMYSLYVGGDCEERESGYDEGLTLWRCPPNGNHGNMGEYCN